VNVAIYARTSAADQGRTTVEQILADLTTAAERRGWSVALACSDRGPGLVGRREGLLRLLQAVRTRAVQAVVVKSLGQMARSLRHLSELGQLLSAKGVALVALAESIDTTNPMSAIRWRDWLEISGALDHHVRAEAAKVARLRPSGGWGRPVAVINPLELLAFWEGRGNRRPLSLREIAPKLGVSVPTVRTRLRELREAGKVDDEARAGALARAGGLRRGGRPAGRLDDADLLSLWARQIRRNSAPSLYTIARALRVSRSRVERRLRELDLLKGEE